MKKFSLLLAICTMTVLSYAQDMTGMNDQPILKSKRGHVILPEAGDIALGFDAVPVLNFALNAVNIMNNTGQGAQHPGYVGGFDQVIVGKYFLSDDLAVRARFGVNTLKLSDKIYGDDPLTPNAVVPVNILLQTSSTSFNDFFLAAGLEYRRGHNRLQGYYGGELLIGLGSQKVSNNYEVEFNRTAVDSGFISNGSTRVLSDKSGVSFTLGLRGFAGVEYFILPKMSIGAEFGWGLGMVTQPRGSATTETWGIEPGSGNQNPDRFETETKGNNGGSTFGFQVDNGSSRLLGGSAALTLHFHF
jgi:hypothetical protein